MTEHPSRTLTKHREGRGGGHARPGGTQGVSWPLALVGRETSKSTGPGNRERVIHLVKILRAAFHQIYKNANILTLHWFLNEQRASSITHFVKAVAKNKVVQ